MALCKAAFAATNVVAEAECAFSRLDAFKEVLRLAAGISTGAVWELSIRQLITSFVTFAQGKLLIDQAGARFVGASMTCFVARDIITFARDQEANLAPKEVLEAFGLGTGECAQSHWRLAVRQQGTFLVAKRAQKFLIMRTNVAIEEVLRSCQRVRGENLDILAASQVIDRPDLMWQQAVGGLVWCSCGCFLLHSLPSVRIDSGLLLRSQEIAALQSPAAAGEKNHQRQGEGAKDDAPPRPG